MKSNWWYEASPEDRMSQVKNGAQIGMTVDQVAFNLKVKPVVIRFFAKDHNIKFKEERKPNEVLLVEPSFSPGDEAFMATNALLDVEDGEFMLDIIQTFGDMFTSSIEEWN